MPFKKAKAHGTFEVPKLSQLIHEQETIHPFLLSLSQDFPPYVGEGVELIFNIKAFENTSTSVAASQMRNALNNLADTVTDKEEKKVCHSRGWNSKNGLLCILDMRYLTCLKGSQPRFTSPVHLLEFSKILES